jgi:uncharacterized protein YndB with AHSA1/START domain
MAEELLFDEVFPAPRAQVFAYFADPKKLGRLWSSRFKRLTAGTDPQHPDGIGAVREVNAGAFRWEETITAFRPDELIEYSITKGANVKAHRARIRFSDDPRGTRVVYEVRFESKVPATGAMFAATMRLSWTIGVPKMIQALQREAWG